MKPTLTMMKSFLRRAGTACLALAVLAIGYLFGRWSGSSPAAPSAAAARRPPAPGAAAKKQVQIWTCSMHPQIRLPHPEKCPICGMDLIPLQAGGGPAVAADLTLDPGAVKRMQVRTVPVERRFVEAAIRMVGRVNYDETRVAAITAWVPGRLDRLFVDYTGVPVKKGEHMVSLYSPEILTAQEELLQAIQAVKRLQKSRSAIVRATARATVAAARQKLALWGLTAKQIAEIERRGKPSDHITIYAPASGIVVRKNAVEGMYVKTGAEIYTIADLSHLWIELDAYESDLEWLCYGQKVTFTPEAYPGEVFSGIIAFIDPVVNSATRTVTVRVNAENPRLRLKPGMFVRAVVRAKIAEGGRVMVPDLAGKWVCPMHPGVIRDASGKCPICGMPLVRAESLGYVPLRAGKPPLVIPATAPLITGTRAVVYVQLPNHAEPTFQGRQIRLGPRAGDFYIVRSGLKAGERVVVNGNFKIDAELQIQAKPSMMSPAAPPPGANTTTGEKGAESAGPAPVRRAPAVVAFPSAFRRGFSAVVDAYLEIQAALSSDRPRAALEAARAFQRAVTAVDSTRLSARLNRLWGKRARELRKFAGALAGSRDLRQARLHFSRLSSVFIGLLREFAPALPRPLVQIHCPMAFNNRGADWLQTGAAVKNPYYGAAMLRCGEKVRQYPPAAPAKPAPPKPR